MDAAKLVQVYIKMRDKRAELKEAYEAEDKTIEEKMMVIEQTLLEMCKETGVESLRTVYGTATRKVQERVWVADWEAFKEFVRENDAIDLLEKRVHQGNFKTWASEHPDAVAPVNIDRKFAITVRRSS